MTITWNSLASAGAPAKISTIAAEYVQKRKLLSQPPTSDANSTIAIGAAGSIVTIVDAPEAPSGTSHIPASSATTTTSSSIPAFTFPGAVDILNAAPPRLPEDEDEDEDDDDDDEEDDDARYERICALAAKTDCDAMRRKIQRFLARKTMTQTAFLRAIGDCNSNSYRKFMSYKGKFTGENNQVYDGALLFFHKLEKKEGKAVASKPPKGAAGSAASSSADKTAGAAKGSRKQQQLQTQELLDKINAVVLPEPVYVFDDCDDIRRKINELIESKKVTQAALLRELDVNSNSLRRFLTTKGKREGCSNGVYYSAYCFFEKMRIAHGVAKTTKRNKNEREMRTGYSLKRDPTHMWVFTGKRGFK